ncbi:MAG: hypothetical protein AAFN93_19915 [Bacteroidota bacterium]
MSQSEKLSKPLCIIASILLLIMALFHGSGINYVNDIVKASNVEGFIKDIFPVLFILPTIQLIGLAVFGFIAISMKQLAYKILIPVSTFAFIDALFAFYLNAIIPGLILILPTVLYMLAAYWYKSSSEPKTAN